MTIFPRTCFFSERDNEPLTTKTKAKINYMSALLTATTSQQHRNIATTTHFCCGRVLTRIHTNTFASPALMTPSGDEQFSRIRYFIGPYLSLSLCVRYVQWAWTWQHPWLRPGWKILPIRLGSCSCTNCVCRFRCGNKDSDLTRRQPHFHHVRLLRPCRHLQ